MRGVILDIVFNVSLLYAEETRRKLCAQSCKANFWVYLFYNPISLLCVIVWTALARYNSFFFSFLSHTTIMERGDRIS